MPRGPRKITGHALGRQRLTLSEAETPGRIPGLPDLGMQSDSVQGGSNVAGEFWWPTKGWDSRQKAVLKTDDETGDASIFFFAADEDSLDEENRRIEIVAAYVVDGSDYGSKLRIIARGKDVTDRAEIEIDSGSNTRAPEMSWSLFANGAGSVVRLARFGSSRADLQGLHRSRDFVQGSTVSVTHSNQSSVTTAVSFSEAFSVTPLAVVAVADTARSDVVCTVGAIDTVGFNLTTRQINDTNISATFNVRWIALGGAA